MGPGEPDLGAILEVPLRPRRQPFDHAGMLGYLAAHAAPGVEACQLADVDDPERGGRYRRLHVEVIRGTPVACMLTLDLVGGDPRLTIEPTPDEPMPDEPTPHELLSSGGRGSGHLDRNQTSTAQDEVGTDTSALHLNWTFAELIEQVSSRGRDLLDLDADPALVFAHFAKDAVLGPLIRRAPGIRVPGSWDPFEVLVKVIIGQQISVAGARTMVGRLVREFGRPLATTDPAVDRCFPTPIDLEQAPLEAHGFIATRSKAIRAASHAVLRGSLTLDHAMEPRLLHAQLLAIPGIGPWTASIVTSRVCGDRDRFPPGDLALRRAAGGGSPIASAELDRLAVRWSPLRSYAAQLLWRAAYL